MYIRGNKLIELLEEFKATNPKKEERIPYEEWRKLVKFLTVYKDFKLQVKTEPSILIITYPASGERSHFNTGDYFIKFFQERPEVETPLISDPMTGQHYYQNSDGTWESITQYYDTITPVSISSSDTLDYNATITYPQSYLRLNSYGELEYWLDPPHNAETPTENLSKGSSNKMNLNLNNLFDFGPMIDGNVMYSPYGLAFRNSNNQYLTYNPTTKKTTDVTGLTIDLEGFIYKVPVGLNSVKPGDIIIHNGKPICVEGIEDHSVICVDIENSELKTVIPPTNIFGFNYVTKITPLFNLGSANPSEDNPFGNIMPYLLFSTLNGGEDATKSKNGFDMQTLLLMSLLNGNADGNFFGNIFGNGQA